MTGADLHGRIGHALSELKRARSADDPIFIARCERRMNALLDALVMQRSRAAHSIDTLPKNRAVVTRMG